MYAIVNTFNNLVIDLCEEYEEYGPSPSGFAMLTIEVPEGMTVELGYEYDSESGTFAPEDRSKYPAPEPEPEPEPTDSEILEKIAINSEYLAAMAEMEATE